MNRQINISRGLYKAKSFNSIYTQRLLISTNKALLWGGGLLRGLVVVLISNKTDPFYAEG